MSKAHFTKVPHWLLPLVVDGSLQPGALVTYSAIGKYVNGRTGLGAFPSVATLAGDTGYSERTVQRHLAELERAGAVVKTARYIRGQQSSNYIQLVITEPQGGDTSDTPRGDMGVTLTRSNELDAAAAVPEVGEQQQQTEDGFSGVGEVATPPDQQQHIGDIALCDGCDRILPVDPTPDGRAQLCGECMAAFLLSESADQQQQEDAPAATMEEAVGIVVETLGGEVVAEDFIAEPRVWVCDGCMRPVLREGIADMVDGEHVLCKTCKAVGPPAALPHSGAAETIGEQMARSGHGVRSTTLNPNPEPGNQRPFPVVEQRKLQNWFNVTDGAPWYAAWSTACAAPTDVWYDPAAHLAIYLSRCREERRAPRSDLWLRFYIEDRAKHIQTLQHEADAAMRREEDPQQREERSNRKLPPVWGDGEGA